jgi:hypothetical protein
MHFKKRILTVVLTLAMTLSATATLAPSSVYAVSTPTTWHLAYYPNLVSSASVPSWSGSVIASANTITITTNTPPTGVKLGTTVGNLGTHYLTSSSIRTAYLVTKGFRYAVTVKYVQNAGVKSVLSGDVL